MILNDKKISWLYSRPNGIRSYDHKRNMKTRCMIKKGDKVLAVGEALCGGNDSFCKETGRKISMARALKELFPAQKEKRAEFWNAYRTLGKYPRWKLDSKQIVREIVNTVNSVIN